MTHAYCRRPDSFAAPEPCWASSKVNPHFPFALCRWAKVPSERTLSCYAEGVVLTPRRSQLSPPLGRAAGLSSTVV
jgi:hypothetical protein